MTKHVPWTDEDRYLLCNVGSATYHQIGQALGRTQESTRKRFQKLKADAELLGNPLITY